jgi:hypothetical protein
VNLLFCMKLFALCSYSCCVSITIVFPLSAFVMVSLFIDTSFFMSVISFHSFLFFLLFMIFLFSWVIFMIFFATTCL